MLYFKSFPDAKKILLLAGREYVLGRKDCDIVIDNDPSVSRKHAILKVTHQESNVMQLSKTAIVTLKDVSKFGTFINGQKVIGEKQLQGEDEIRFGSPKSVYVIVNEPFVISTSCLDSAGKKDIRSVVSQLGGHIASEWRKECNYLVMKHVSVTIKVVCALAAQKYIVTPKYIADYLAHLKGEISQPDPEDYLPPVTERQIKSDVSFFPDQRRSNVFQGMLFYFLSQNQFEKMNMAIELGGGVPLLASSSDASSMDAFLEEGAVVMNSSLNEVQNEEQNTWTEKVKLFLQAKGRRLIQDAEVGYAVLYCSTEDYCNPAKDISHLLFMPVPSQSLSQAAIPSPQSETRSMSLGQSIAVTVLEQENQGRRDNLTMERKAVPINAPPSLDRNDSRDIISLSAREMTITKKAVPASSSIEQHKIPATLVSNAFSPEDDVRSKVTVKQELLTPAKFESNQNHTHDSTSKPPSFGHQIKLKVVAESKKSGVTFKDNDRLLAIRSQGDEEAPIILDDDIVAELDTPFEADAQVIPEVIKSEPLVTSPKTISLLEDSDEVIEVCTSRKLPLSKTKSKRKFLLSEENPFENISKRPKLSTTPLAPNINPSETALENKKDIIPGNDFQQNENLSPSADTSSGSRLAKNLLPVCELGIRNNDSTCSNSTSKIPLLPDSFLTTRMPIKMQVAPNANFERENIDSAQVLIQFENLIVRPVIRNPSKEKTDDVPEGMVKWEGKLVRNFKRFSKVLHTGANRLPRIIGGRDLEEYLGQSRKELDDWLRENQIAESQQLQRDREAEELFEWKPASKPLGSKSR